MSNKSKKRPRGRLTEEDILSWYSVVKINGEYIYTPGFERIPDNWYKRAIGDEYTIPLFVKDVLVGASIYPKFFALGGNINCSFVGLRAENLTGGVYNFETLSEGNNFYCFLLLTSLQLPDFLQGAGKELARLASFFAAFVNNSTRDLNCPPLTRYDPVSMRSQFAKYPGYMRGMGMDEDLLSLFGL
nr:PREDICTED: uncharacterized protein LOC109043224 [Bemisia tabaci]